MADHSQACELIQQLCLAAGEIMENASPAFAMDVRSDDQLRAELVMALRHASEDLLALAAAVEVLHRRALLASD